MFQYLMEWITSDLITELRSNHNGNMCVRVESTYIISLKRNSVMLPFTFLFKLTIKLNKLPELQALQESKVCQRDVPGANTWNLPADSNKKL